MLLTDTHTHLYYETDPVKRAALMDRCEANQVRRLFLPNVDMDSVAKIKLLTDAYPAACFAMMGLHPCSVKDGWEEELGAIRQAAAALKIYAIGEIGIDRAVKGGGDAAGDLRHRKAVRPDRPQRP